MTGGLIIDNIYDTGTGNLKKIVRHYDNMTIWEGIDYNKHGQLTFSIKGGIKQIREYYPETAYLKSVTASDMQSFEYHYDVLGNMDHRYDHLHKVNGQSLHEQFYYDRRNQLTDTYLNGTLASHIIYDNLGNITSKTATGGFEYQSGNSPYRLTAIVPDQNIDPGYKLSQIITYTDFNKVASITGNGYKLEIEYGLENQRISQSLSSVNQYGQTTLLLNKHFIGGLQEKIFYETGAEKTISYITSPEGLTAIEVKSGITGEWYTVFTDHLGSITTLIRESDGNRFELSYDAWGNRRNPSTWTNYSGNLPDFIKITDTDFITDRGFTGHEHLDMFGLINMNGRVYDPVASRFLSPDSFIQASELALNYNGYVYCLNNPLKYTDPTGEIFVIDDILIAAAIGAILNVTFQGMSGNINSAGDFFMAAGVGALAGAAGGIAGQAVAGAVGTIGFAGGAMTGGAAGFSGGFLTGAGNSWMGGANFGDGLVSGLKTGAIGGLTGGVIGGVAGGIDAVKHGGGFWSGKGATFDALAAPVTDNKIEIGEGMKYSNDYARTFSDDYFGKDVKGVKGLYADGTLPPGYSTEGDVVLNAKGQDVRGSIRYLGTGKGSNVYLFRAAFTSKEQLYLTMGHEYLHAGYLSTGLMNVKSQHASIYEWEVSQAKAWGLNGTFYDKYVYYKPYNDSAYDYNKLGFFIVNIRQW